MPDRPTAEQLAEWQRLSDAAHPIDRYTRYSGGMLEWFDVLNTNGWQIGQFWAEADAAFYVAAHTAVPALLAEVAELGQRLRLEEGYWEELALALLPVVQAALAYMDVMLIETANWKEHQALRAAIDALPTNLRAELEAGDADRD